MQWLSELVDENFLAVLDVAFDIEKELQLTDNIIIPSLPSIVKFRELMPIDSINMRKRYWKLRWKAANLLKNKGVVDELEHIDKHLRFESNMKIVIGDMEKFKRFLKELKEEYNGILY